MVVSITQPNSHSAFVATSFPSSLQNSLTDAAMIIEHLLTTLDCTHCFQKSLSCPSHSSLHSPGSNQRISHVYNFVNRS